ncbi:MAG: 3-oxoacyl-ACP synthase III [Roseiflexaceae bacterium]|nr:3-oxoacyl-ACP synthase III [Roseiflexaceae bacterium]
MLFQNVSIEAVAYELPPHRVTSADLEDQIAPTMERLGVPQGRIEELAGIRERRFWEPGAMPSEVATLAARAAIERAGVDYQQIGAMVSTSVSRDYIEPSTACLIHGNLGLSSACLNYDISNACLGFVTGIAHMAMMIERGEIEYALVVNGESAREVVEATIRRLQNPNCNLQTFRDNFATLTIGSSAVAMVLGRKDRSKTGHSVNGVVSLCDTTSNRLCLGQPDYMKTDASALLVAGVKLAAATWQKAQAELPNWSDAEIAQYAPHQVGSRHNAAVAQTLGMTPAKVYVNYTTLGNIGPAAVPVSLAQAVDAGRVHAGDQIGMLGIGSGINCSMMSVTW